MDINSLFNAFYGMGGNPEPDSVVYDSPDWKRKVRTKLRGYKDKNFVKRILKPEKYPKLSGIDEEGREYEKTHFMTVSSDEKRYYMYPKVVQQPNGELTELDDKEAYKYARENKEFIPFRNKDKAVEFSKYYKKIWDK